MPGTSLIMGMISKAYIGIVPSICWQPQTLDWTNLLPGSHGSWVYQWSKDAQALPLASQNHISYRERLESVHVLLTVLLKCFERIYPDDKNLKSAGDSVAWILQLNLQSGWSQPSSLPGLDPKSSFSSKRSGGNNLGRPSLPGTPTIQTAMAQNGNSPCSMPRSLVALFGTIK